MNTLLFDQVQEDKRRRRKLNRILILQAPILAGLMVLLAKMPLSARLIMDGLLLLWVYWIYLRNQQLSGIAEIIDSYIAAVVTKKQNNFENKKYVPWNTYSHKSAIVTKPSTIVAIIILFAALYKPHLRILLVFVLVIDGSIFVLAKLVSIIDYASNTAKVWAEKTNALAEEPQKTSTIWKAFLVGYSIGLAYLFVIYHALSMMPIQYFLYYFIFSTSLALNLAGTQVSQYLIRVVTFVDSHRVSRSVERANE